MDKNYLRLKAEEILKKNGIMDNSIFEKDLKTIIEELNIYQIELEHQNEELINTQNELIKSNEKYADLFNNAPIGYLILDFDNRIVEINKKAESLFNVQKNELNGFNFTKLIHPNSQDTFYLYINKIHQHNKNSNQCELELKKTDSLYFNAQLHSISEIEKGKKFLKIAIIDISSDIETKKIQLESIKAIENDKMKSLFLANMSHEIRTPLNGIVGMTEILIKTPITDSQKEYLEIIKQSSDNLMNIVNDILDISKIEAGKMNLAPTITKIALLKNKIINTFESLINDKPVQLRINISQFVPNLIKVDEKRLMQIMYNLLSNAIKFTEKGEITINFVVLEKDISLNNIKIKIEVIDTGIGIKNEELNKLFHKFSQIDSSLSKNHKGTGLGLVISKELIHLLGGEISVESTFEKGSNFSFTFMAEIQEEKENMKEITVSNNFYEKLSLNVLLVEDMIVNQKVASLFLTNIGCNVDVANNGVEAIEKCQNKQYDIIFMDIQMPIMDGITAKSKIKLINQSIPIVAMTAYSLNGDREKFISQGFSEYISKPISLSSLYKIIKTLISI